MDVDEVMVALCCNSHVQTEKMFRVKSFFVRNSPRHVQSLAVVELRFVISFLLRGALEVRLVTQWVSLRFLCFVHFVDGRRTSSSGGLKPRASLRVDVAA